MSVSVAHREVGKAFLLRWRAEKAAHPGKIVGMQAGHFVEFFEDDAAQVSQALGIALNGQLGVPMCGLPAPQAVQLLERAGLDAVVIVAEPAAAGVSDAEPLGLAALSPQQRRELDDAASRFQRQRRRVADLREQLARIVGASRAAKLVPDVALGFDETVIDSLELLADLAATTAAMSAPSRSAAVDFEAHADRYWSALRRWLDDEDNDRLQAEYDAAAEQATESARRIVSSARGTLADAVALAEIVNAFAHRSDDGPGITIDTREDEGDAAARKLVEVVLRLGRPHAGRRAA